MSPAEVFHRRGGEVFRDVEHRLEAAGAWAELRHLHGFSADEVDRLIERERSA